MESFFSNKTVVVTGGTDGIGKALVEQLLLLNARVATCGRNEEKLATLKNSHLQKNLLTSRADVSSEEDCKNFIQSVLTTYGHIDILINNAGVSMRSLMKDVSMDTMRQVMDINYFGSVYCTKYALASIIECKGIIVGVSSIAGYRGLPGRTGYSASKYALQGWLEGLRVELMDAGVHVMWVCPGFTASNIRNAALTADGSLQGKSPLDEHGLMTSETCAAITLKAIAKKKRTLIYTWADKRTVWLNKLLPALTDSLVKKFFFKNGTLVK